MLGESSNAEKRARRVLRGSVLITTVRRRGAVPGLERRLRAAPDVPASGQIVFRGGAYQVLR